MLFKILVYGYQCGIYTTRKLEEACRYRIDFKWLLWDEPVPDHSTISRFRTGRCAEAVEDLFYQYVRYLEEQGETDHETVFIDGTKLESCAGRYTFVWRKSVEKQLAKVKEKVLSAVSITSLEALEQHLAKMASEITFVHGPGHRKIDAQKEWEALDELRRRWRDYEEKLAVMGTNRNSYCRVCKNKCTHAEWKEVSFGPETDCVPVRMFGVLTEQVQKNPPEARISPSNHTLDTGHVPRKKDNKKVRKLASKTSFRTNCVYALQKRCS